MSDQIWSQVDRFEDGDSLNADTLNKPIGQLSERTYYLLSRLNRLGGDRSSIVIENAALATGESTLPEKGNVVYLTRENDKDCFAKAEAKMSLYDDFTADNGALAVGILIDRRGEYGDVLLYGKMSLQTLTFGVEDMIETGETFRAGRYYLSSREAGKLTANPNGPLIYVCVIEGDSSKMALVNPQFLDIGTSHVHRTAVLVSRPAGYVVGGSVVGYPCTGGTPGSSPSLLFGGTWTSRTFGVEYAFKIAYSSVTGTKLCWGDNEVDIEPNGGFVDIENGLRAKLIVPSGAAVSDGMAWDSMAFPDAAKGWVDHVTFDGDEDPDAAYDYNLGMDMQVSNYWPPVPPKSAALVVNGVEMDNKVLLPDNPTVSFNRSTICWYEDDEGKKPWPEDATNRYSAVDPSDDKNEVMHWVRCFQGATGPVTSIQPRKDSPIKIYGYGTDSSANVGDLEIDADIDFEIVDQGLPGFNVPKSGRGGKLLAGPVVEKIVGGAGISVISRAGCPEGQGVVSIGLENTYRSQFVDIALENAEQAKIGMFPYVRLKGYQGSTIPPSAFTATMRVPTSVPAGSYALMVQATVFGEASFGEVTTEATQRIAGVELNYNILPDFSDDEYKNLRNGLMKPNTARIVNIPFGHGQPGNYSYSAFDPMVVSTYQGDSEPAGEAGVISYKFGHVIPFASEFSGQVVTGVELKPGYLVGLRFARVAPSEGNAYTGAVGFINLSWTLVSI